jgi:hypothetical protein
MKKILASLVLCVSVISYADEPKEMYMPNDAGGFVVLTIELCKFKEISKEYPYRAYATESSDAVYHEGCWVSPNISSVPTQIISKSEGAGEPPTLHVIRMVNTWWEEGGRATFTQRNFRPEKKRYLSNGTLESTLPPIIVKPK